MTRIAQGQAADLHRELRDLLCLSVVGDQLRWVIPLNWVPDGWLNREQAERLLADRLHVVSSWARLRRSQATDDETAQLLEAVAAGLESR